MFDRLRVPRLPLRLAGFSRAGGSRASRRSLLLGIAIAIAISAGLTHISAGRAQAADSSDASGSSIQYQEALSHAGAEYPFTPGGVVNVPFRPRHGDMALVDGAPPVPLPAAKGVAPATPKTTSPALVTPAAAGSYLRREVFGFLPYWELGSTLDYSTLSTVAYFGINLNTDGTLSKTGNGWNGWVSTTLTSAINAAHANSTRVALTVESFAWDSNGVANQTALLSSPTASLTAAQQIAAEVGNRGVDGVNLDFEPIAPGQSANFIAFTRTLRVELDKVHPGYELTFCGTGHPNTYDLPNLLAAGAADAVFIMGYDFRGGSPATTGSIDPLTSPYIAFDITDAVNVYLSQAPASKVILGLPWYGHAWSTGAVHTGNVAPASPAVYGQPAAVYYSTAAPLAAMNDSTHLGKMYDTVEQTAWTAYYGSYGGLPTWRELYFDDAQALTAKIAAIDHWNLRGLGIWALGYDTNSGNGDLTAAVRATLEVEGSTYTAISPRRILDTRPTVASGNPTNIALSGKFTAGTVRVFGVAGARYVGGGTAPAIPVNAIAVTGNLTIVNETAPGVIDLGPAVTAGGTTSSLNFVPGETRADNVTLGLAAGTLSAVYRSSTAGATTDLIFDLTGYFLAGAGGATYHTVVTPGRVLDTRPTYGNNTHIGPFGTLPNRSVRSFPVVGVTGLGWSSPLVPSGAVAVTGNVTVTNATSLGYVALGPTMSAWPSTSTANVAAATNVANGVTVALSGGSLQIVWCGLVGSSADVIFDVTGYFTAGAGGLSYYPITPTRVMDSSKNLGITGPFASRTAQLFTIPDVMAGAAAISGNLTLLAPTTNGWALVTPEIVASPMTSTVNASAGHWEANGFDVAIGTSNHVALEWAGEVGSTANLSLDITGYFLP